MIYTQFHHKNNLCHCLTPSSKPTTFVKPDDEQDSTPTTRPPSLPQCSTRSSSTGHLEISHVRHYIISLTLDLLMPLPSPSLENLPTINIPVIEIEEYCNGVVQPVTKETITHNRKMIKDPLLRDLWLKAMSKELHCLAQGCTGITKGTNTTFFLSHADICNPSNRTVTYACIVINHCPPKVWCTPMWGTK
jgi:hypothetical protein